MTWLDFLLTQTAPVLPATWILQWGRVAGWAVVLACAGVVLARRQSMQVRIGIAVALAVWACVPGEWSPTFWLGLAFQSPSLLGCLLCLYGATRVSVVRNGEGKAAPAAGLDSAHGGSRWATSAQAVFGSRFAWAGVALGYVLMLDTLALLPVQIYAWGFEPMALLIALAVSMLPWICGVRGALPWAAPLALVLFSLSRLPTGNVWDALLDPITWVGLQLWLAVRVRAR